MSELQSGVEGNTWLLVRRGTIPKKIMEIILLCSDGSEDLISFAVSAYCEKKTFVFINRVMACTHVPRKEKRGKGVCLYSVL